MYHFIYLWLLFGITACQGEMRVNDIKIDLSSQDLSKSGYDAVGTYYFIDGELAKFTCHREVDKRIYNFHKLIFNVSDTTHETGTDKDDVNLYLKLRNNHSPKHIDCAMRRIFNKDIKNNIRLFLKPLTDQIDYPHFQVNGLSLRPSKNDYNHDYTFVYEYYPGEDLFVSSTLDTRRFKSMSCNGVNFTSDIILDPKEISELSLKISTHQFTSPQASVDCLVKAVQRYSTTTAKNVRVSIKFIEDTMKFFPYVTGIQWPKIIAKFYNDVNSKTIGPLYTSYKSNENTTLQCYSNTTGVKWSYGPEINSTFSTITIKDNTYSVTTNDFYTSITFQLTENVSKTILECKHDTLTSKVVLMQQKELTKSTSHVISTENAENGSNGNTDATATNDSSIDEGNSGGSGLNFLPIIIGVISIVIVLLIITLIMCICIRKKLPKKDTDINYENLPANKELTNRFKNENIEDSYAQVIPKSQRNQLPEIYSEPLSNDKNSCYAIPYNVNSAYAEITPKSQRNGNTPSEPENFDSYAQIIPKTLRNVGKNQVLPANDDCAEDGAKIRDRVDTDKQKYANVFDSEMYVNVSSSDSVQLAS